VIVAVARPIAARRIPKTGGKRCDISIRGLHK
jgi:hypothetical protein